MAVEHPTFLSKHSKPIVLFNDRIYVTNTPADTLDVIDTDPFSATFHMDKNGYTLHFAHTGMFEVSTSGDP